MLFPHMPLPQATFVGTDDPRQGISGNVSSSLNGLQQP